MNAESSIQTLQEAALTAQRQTAARMNSVPDAGPTRQLEIIMNATNWERWSAASGYVVILLGVAAAFERGGPAANPWVSPSAKARLDPTTHRPLKTTLSTTVS